MNKAGLVKEALPEYSDYIDKYGYTGYHYLLKPLKDKLFSEIVKMLDGEEIDAKSVENAIKILSASDKMNKESTEIFEPTSADITEPPAN